MIIAIQCQHCGRSFEYEAADKSAICPECGKETLAAAARVNATQTQDEIAELRFRAKLLNWCACGLLALSVAVPAIVYAANFNGVGNHYDNLRSGSLVIAGTLATGAAWLFFMAQIIHIRANTHK